MHCSTGGPGCSCAFRSGPQIPGALSSWIVRYAYSSARRLARSTPNVRTFAKSAKRLKYSHSSDKHARGNPVYIRVEPDGSDLWRLDIAIKLLKDGAVSL